MYIETELHAYTKTNSWTCMQTYRLTLLHKQALLVYAYINVWLLFLFLYIHNSFWNFLLCIRTGSSWYSIVVKTYLKMTIQRIIFGLVDYVCHYHNVDYLFAVQ